VFSTSPLSLLLDCSAATTSPVALALTPWYSSYFCLWRGFIYSKGAREPQSITPVVGDPPSFFFFFGVEEAYYTVYTARARAHPPPPPRHTDFLYICRPPREQKRATEAMRVLHRKPLVVASGAGDSGGASAASDRPWGGRPRPAWHKTRCRSPYALSRVECNSTGIRSGGGSTEVAGVPWSWAGSQLTGAWTPVERTGGAVWPLPNEVSRPTDTTSLDARSTRSRSADCVRGCR
jgi:hypothetical protein